MFLQRSCLSAAFLPAGKHTSIKPQGYYRKLPVASDMKLVVYLAALLFADHNNAIGYQAG